MYSMTVCRLESIYQHLTWKDDLNFPSNFFLSDGTHQKVIFLLLFMLLTSYSLNLFKIKILN